jgi:hypothetical protein
VVSDDPGHTYHQLDDGTIVTTSEAKKGKTQLEEPVQQATGVEPEDLSPIVETAGEHTVTANPETEQSELDNAGFERLERAIAVINGQIDDQSVDTADGRAAIANLNQMVQQLRLIEDSLRNRQDGFRPHLRQLSRTIATAMVQFDSQFRVQDVLDGLPTFPEAKAGTYNTLRGMAETAPDGSTQEAHHVPAKELAQAIARAISRTLESEANNVAAGRALAALRRRRDAIVSDPNGGALSAVLLHRVTHANSGGLSVHATAIADSITADLDALEQDAAARIVRISTQAGAPSVNPSGKTFDTWMLEVRAEAARRVEEATSDAEEERIESAADQAIEEARVALAEVEAEGEGDALETLAAQINLAFDSAWTQGFAAVRMALNNSVLDGPQTDRARALSDLEGRARGDWSTVLGGS